MQRRLRHLALLLADLSIRKDPETWVFGSCTGFASNVRRVFDVARNAGGRLRLVVIAQSDTEAERVRAIAGDSAIVVHKGSYRAKLWVLRAGVIVISHDAPRDVGVRLKQSRRRLVVNVWHEISIKRHWLLTDEIPDLYKTYERKSSAFAYIVAASAADAVAKSATFSKPLTRILVTGAPRNDWLYCPDYDEAWYTEHHGVIWDYDAVFPGPRVNSAEELTGALARALESPSVGEEMKLKYEYSRRLFHQFRDTESGVRAFDAIRSRTG